MEKITPPTTGGSPKKDPKNENKKGQSRSNPSKGKTISTSRKDKEGSPKPVNADENNNFDSFCKEMKELMVNLHGALTKHDNALEQVCNRLSTLEDYSCEDYGYDEYEEGEVLETHPAADVTPDIHNTSTGSSEKVSRFSELSRQFKSQETTCPDVEEGLAETVTAMFRNGIEDDKYAEMIRDEKNPRPGNCDGLVTVKMNPLVMDAMSTAAKANDRRLMYINTSVVKAATILVKTVNKMSEMESENPVYKEFVDNCFSSLALLGHANRQIQWARRDIVKPELKDEYAHLCNHTLPYTSFLFGDDVSKAAKEIEDTAKISNKINRNYRGGYRGRPFTRGPRFRGRARGAYRGTSVGRYHPYGYYNGPSASYQEPKNFPRRGISKTTQKM